MYIIQAYNICYNIDIKQSVSTLPRCDSQRKLFHNLCLGNHFCYFFQYYTITLFFALLSSRPSQGSRDNMSIVLVCFPNAPKVSEEAVRKDAELNKYLESRVEGENGWMKENNQCLLYVPT